MNDYIDDDYIDSEGYVYCEICGQVNGVVDEHGNIHDGGPAMGYACDCVRREEVLLKQFDAWFRECWEEIPSQVPPERLARHAAVSAFVSASGRSREANQRLFDAVTELLDALQRTVKGDLPEPVLMEYLEITYQIRERLDEARQVGFFWLSEAADFPPKKETA